MADVVVSGSGGSYRVEVRDGARTTTHDVTVPGGLAATLGWDGEEQALLEESFRFLLAREPASSILRSFRLDVIGDYFPEYRREVSRRA